MPKIHLTPSRPATALLVLALVSLALAACGSSSKSSTSTATSSTSTASAKNASAAASPGTSSTGTSPSKASSATGRRGAFQARFAALRTCLSKHGITLPQASGGRRARGARGFFGAPKLPAGVTLSQYDAALRACGRFPRSAVPGLAQGFNTPKARAALAKLTSCMREHGVALPNANTSGRGPIFKGANVTSPTFKNALAKCRNAIAPLLPRRPGGPTGAG